MESPPSFSTLSEAPAISEDSGLLITSGSFSSDSASGWHHVASELQESDFDERSLSLCESTETSERMCGDFFNTVKKGPAKVALSTIEPPPEFQDNPHVNVEICSSEGITTPVVGNKLANKSKSVGLDIPTTSSHFTPKNSKPESVYERRQCLNHRFASPRLLHLSPCRATRPSSRSSLSSRLSSSHNSLVTQFQADDSNFITQAISHDTLSAKTSDITDVYNVPFDSDIYAVPVDVVCPNITGVKSKKTGRYNKKRGKSTPQNIGMSQLPNDRNNKPKENNRKEHKSKRHSLPSSSGKKSCTDSDSESNQVTLRELRRFLHDLYSSSSDSEYRGQNRDRSTTVREKSDGSFTVSIHARQPNNMSNDATASNAVFLTESPEVEVPRAVETNNNDKKNDKNAGISTKSRKHKEGGSKDVSDVDKNDKALKKASSSQSQKTIMTPVRMLSLNLKQSFCNLFRWRRHAGEGGAESERSISRDLPAAVRRALPPLPHCSRSRSSRRSAAKEEMPDFASSIQKAKDYGWYWGPITVDTAERILSNEPDGSFIVRDSSDDHYIFTLTFKLNGLRHVRIEHDQGNFCFGGCTMFKAATIVEFIENAVETSRSGRYLFFLNLRPILGPVRVQLLYPVSRFKRVQSLQHLARFVILKNVRRDLIPSLPLPRRLLDYLNATQYYSEMLAEI